VSARHLKAAPPLLEAATPRAAVTEARTRRAPVLLSRHILADCIRDHVRIWLR
jgi:hypothetical protein